VALAADDRFGRVSTRSATWFAIVPEGNHSARSLPSNAASRSCSALIVGSSPYWSSPTGAAAIAARIAAVGWVTVSERRSIRVLGFMERPFGVMRAAARLSRIVP
jgi:hypothetical protein